MSFTKSPQLLIIFANHPQCLSAQSTQKNTNKQHHLQQSTTYSHTKNHSQKVESGEITTTGKNDFFDVNQNHYT